MPASHPYPLPSPGPHLQVLPFLAITSNTPPARHTRLLLASLLLDSGGRSQAGGCWVQAETLPCLASPLSWVLWGPLQHLSPSSPTSSGHPVWLMRVRRLLPIHLTRSIHSPFSQLRAVRGVGWGDAPFPPPPHASALPLPHWSHTTAPQPPDQCTRYLVPAIPFPVYPAGPFLDAPPASRGPPRRVGASNESFAPRLHDPAL